jgi:hypothetical protein
MLLKRKWGEHEEQVALIKWCRLNKVKYPELQYIFAIPNAGKRSLKSGKWLVDEGLLTGVYDLFLPVARGIWHGLFIEMKFGKNDLTENQKTFNNFVYRQKYYTDVCWSWIEAQKTIEFYLNL